MRFPIAFLFAHLDVSTQLFLWDIKPIIEDELKETVEDGGGHVLHVYEVLCGLPHSGLGQGSEVFTALWQSSDVYLKMLSLNFFYFIFRLTLWKTFLCLLTWKACVLVWTITMDSHPSPWWYVRSVSLVFHFSDFAWHDLLSGDAVQEVTTGKAPQNLTRPFFIHEHIHSRSIRK